MEKLTALVGFILAISLGLMALSPCIYAETVVPDNDGDGVPDDMDLDDDNDGVPDMEELIYGSDPFDPNSYPVVEEML
ncbi:MAG: hypothetical protein EFT35_03205 [Methanophagales archaeon ANME-1-THS]|nr:MAG: hypothetical protein EFT35_03205 [Methanophagales archaeon ANME-1-THS]